MDELNVSGLSDDGADIILKNLERLTGQQAPLNSIEICKNRESSLSLLKNGGRGLGYSQFNELLLLHGYDRVRKSFFLFLLKMILITLKKTHL